MYKAYFYAIILMLVVQDTIINVIMGGIQLKLSFQWSRKKTTVGNSSKTELISKIRELEAEGYKKVGKIYKEKSPFGIIIFYQKMKK